MWRLLEKGASSPFFRFGTVLQYEIVVVGDAFLPGTAVEFAKHRVDTQNVCHAPALPSAFDRLPVH
ncbi:MAG: hypothetical protein H6948_00460 [Zoogloeaceae bacterium]|nr:hypothetical protein [Zoogloeaceae bacterium]